MNNQTNPERVAVMLRADIVNHLETFSKITGVGIVDFIEAYLESMMNDTFAGWKGLSGTPELMLTGWPFDAAERVLLEKWCMQEVGRIRTDMMMMAATVAG
jgi:hypothetical protein